MGVRGLPELPLGDFDAPLGFFEATAGFTLAMCPNLLKVRGKQTKSE
jgi:hypothetical protein